MPILHAVVLGLVQGLAEFLPVSSSGHLLLVPWLFGWHDFDDKSVEKAFDVALHLGTLVAVVAYFGRDLWVYVRDGALVMLRRRPMEGDGRTAVLILLSALPAAAIGAVFESVIDERLGTPLLIAISLIVFGVVLLWADRKASSRHLESLRMPDALQVGAAQILSLNPGTSRSGITITAARWLGFERDSAARLSFLMAVPVTAGAVAYKLAKLAKDGVPHGLAVPMLVGIVTAGVAGFVAVWGTLRLVRTHSFAPFVAYRVALGIVVLGLIASPWR